MADDGVATELVQAAAGRRSSGWPAWTLLAPAGAEAVRAESFALGAADGLLGDRVVARAVADRDRFDAMVAGADLVVNTVGLVLPAQVAQGWRSRRGARSPRPAPRPGCRVRRSCCCRRSLGVDRRGHGPAGGRRRAGRRRAQGRRRHPGPGPGRGALLPGLPGCRRHRRWPPRPTRRGRGRRGHPPGRQRQRARRAPPRPLERWLSAAEGTPVAATIAGLEDAVGGAPAQGRRWVA